VPVRACLGQDPRGDGRTVRFRLGSAEILEDVAHLGTRLIMQAAMDAEVEEFLGRARYQRRSKVPEARPGSRNGCAARSGCAATSATLFGSREPATDRRGA
jgi:putative transposase